MTVCFANRSSGSESYVNRKRFTGWVCFANFTLRCTSREICLISDITAEGPPVPIPNTEVKLCWAENTCLETSREDRSLLIHRLIEASFYLRLISKSKLFEIAVFFLRKILHAFSEGKAQSVILPQRVHLFPFRTQKLSSAEPKILAWRRAGKIGHCRHINS